ncbi:MAG: hypothetical protein IJB44_07765 [Clostridia bacterium]|nr:hypothetical protein [Clostridia bacterium]
MKKMKSFVSVLLLLCIMMSFVACAGTAEEEIVPDYSTDLGEVTFMGVDFKFMQKNDEHSTGEDYFGYVVNTEFADLALQRVKEVGAKYDVNIIIETGKDVGSTVQNETYAGLVSADAVQTSGGGLAGILRAGMLYDLTELSDYIDYTNSEKWGNVENLKPLFWDGALFGVIPAAWPMLKFRSMDGPVIVNEDIIRNINQTDPREFVEKDEWTWDKFEELMPIYNHINDAGDEVKAIYTTVHWLFRTIQSTNGEDFIFQDENGEYQLGLHSAQTFEAMATAWDWAFGDYSSFVYIDTNNNWTNMLQAFLDEKSVLTIMNGTDLLGSENSIAYQMDNFGVVPFPRGPLGSNKTNSGTTITDTKFCTAIPYACKDPAMSAIILDAIYEPLPGYESEEDMIGYLRQNFFFDDRDVMNYIDSYNNLIYNYRHEGLTDVYIGINSSKSMREWLDQFAEADEANRVEYAVNIETSIDDILGK